MDELRKRVFEDLSGAVRGEVRCDPVACSMYATDASLYQILPVGVVYPRDEADVIAVAQYAEDVALALIPRGAGSSVTGAVLGRGLVVDFSRYMNRVESIEENTARVQPGVVLERLNRRLLRFGRYLPPDPGNLAVTTIGGMVGVNASGPRSVRVGAMRDHVAGGRMVLSGGRVFEFARLRRQKSVGVAGTADPGAESDHPQWVRDLLSKLTHLLESNRGLIERHQPRWLQNSAGYQLNGVLSETELCLPRLICGSEGTLGLLTSVTVYLSPLPDHCGVALVLFDNLQSAIRCAEALLETDPSACDVVDRRILSLAREADWRFAEIIPVSAEAGLLVEQVGQSDREVKARMRAVQRVARQAAPSARVAYESFDADQILAMWSLPRRVVPLLMGLAGPTAPVPFVEDMAVPPGALQELIHRSQRVLQRHGLIASIYAHAAAGQLHLRPFLPQPPHEHRRVYEQVAEQLYEIVWDLGGTISGTHGDGLSRTPFLQRQYGELYDVFRQVKDLFDPHNIMNPGKIIAGPHQSAVSDFRVPPRRSGEAPELQLRWSEDGLWFRSAAGEDIYGESARCNGCAACRTQQHPLRMCPFFRAESDEANAPRSKANVVRDVLAGNIPREEWGEAAIKELADRCFQCGQCRLECPVNVDIPALMVEAKAAHVASNGLKAGDWLISRVHTLGALGCRASWLANWIIASPFARWILERTLGIHRRRRLPRFARRSFLASLKNHVFEPADSPARSEVVLFVDYYANYHDPDLARALIGILCSNGIRVIVPARQRVSGMAMYSAGDLEPARRLAEQNTRELAEAARDGLPIVCTEPSAVLCMKDAYPRLLDHPDVGLVAEQAVEAGAYLLQLYREEMLQSPSHPVHLTVGYHTPCHTRVLHGGSAWPELLRLIPGLRLHRIDAGCTGMAGTYGLAAENFERSLQIGRPMLRHVAEGVFQVASAECSGCKLQMEQASDKVAVHPLKLLALGYGMLPRLREQWGQPRKRLLVS
ncbi:MAG: FAD-binding oxidoreductase [Planctomycetota bacterium]|nr:MAG: FAD-binding oxidoreductase [Planctomycetota bacterium]